MWQVTEVTLWRDKADDNYRAFCFLGTLRWLLKCLIWNLCLVITVVGPIRAEVLVGIILLLFFPLYSLPLFLSLCVCVRKRGRERPSHLIMRHVQTTATIRTGGGAGISLPLVWLPCVRTNIHTYCLILRAAWFDYDLYLACLPLNLSPLSCFLPLHSIFPPNADSERFVLIMTGLLQWWVCGVACVTSSWQHLLALCLLWRIVALGEASLNTFQTVSPGEWKKARRFADEDKQINLVSNLACDCMTTYGNVKINK